MKFTKTEIDLCRKIAEKHGKEIGYGNWYIEPKTAGGVLLWDYGDSPYFVGDFCSDTVPLWTIEDCLEFLRKKNFTYFTLEFWEGDWEFSLPHSKKSIHVEAKTPLESLLKAVLTVLDE